MHFRPVPDCVVCAYGDGLAVLDQRSNQYFSLDQVGATVWGTLEAAPATGTRLEDLVSAVVAEFDVSREVCAPDIKAFLKALEAAQLVESTA